VIRPRTLPSGQRRYDVRLRLPDGSVHNKTFRTRRDAEAYERSQLVARDRGTWTNPRAGKVTVGAFADRWLDGRTVRGRTLAPRTVESYRYLLDHYVLPEFGAFPLSKVTPGAVRSWHAGLVRSGPATVAPKAYRLLHALFATAVDDGLVGANPCRIKGAGSERSVERRILTPDQVAALADGIEPRWRALVLIAAYGGLRFGELVGLRRRDIDLRRGVVTVAGQLVEVGSGTHQRTAPKSDAGRRTVALPGFVVDELRAHLREYVPPEMDAPVFAGERGGIPLRRNWARIWSRARRAAGLPSTVHLHDLRHTGATLAAQSGGTTKEVMARLGHSTPRAALIYQHAAEDRDQAIAAALDDVGRAAGRRGARDIRAMEP
jgi:integrase